MYAHFSNIVEGHVQELGHNWVDVLKIDIEGAEWEVLDNLLNQTGTLPFTQLQVWACRWIAHGWSTLYCSTLSKYPETHV
jgi:hypothetical protein